MAGFQTNIEKYLAKGIEIFGVSADDIKKQKRFADKYELTYPLLCDTEKNVIKKFGAWGKKKLYGKEYEGIIRSTFVLDEKNVIINVFPKVSPKKHQEELEKVLGI